MTGKTHSRKARGRPPVVEVIRIQKLMIRKVSTLAAQVVERAAAQGLSLRQLAERMGLDRQRLNEMLARRELAEKHFLRLTEALGMQADDWDHPLPRRRTPLEQVRRMRQKVHRIRTEKNRVQLEEPVPFAMLNGTGADGAEKG